MTTKSTSLKPNSEEKIDWWKYEGQVLSLDLDIPEIRLVKRLLEKNQIPLAHRSKAPRGTLQLKKAAVNNVKIQRKKTIG